MYQEEKWKQKFVAWCQQNCLRMKTGKLQELVVAKPAPSCLVNIHGSDFDIVDNCKYLGVHLNKSLDGTVNTRALYKKGQSRLQLLRRLRSFRVQEALPRTFYDSIVASPIFYGVVCWSSSNTTEEQERLNKLVTKS